MRRSNTIYYTLKHCGLVVLGNVFQEGDGTVMP